jgi:hypothetical protein
MLGNNHLRKLITTTTLAAVWCVYSMVALAAPIDTAGEITVTGQVAVNGQSVVSNSTIISGSTITTGPDSSAIISLGKTGRIEMSADSSLTLRFTGNSIVGIVSQGKIRVSNGAGVATTFTTKDTTVIADAGQADSFAIEVECSHTHVDATAGLVTMREGTNDKQVAAGTTAVAGNLSQTGCKPCLRPNSAPLVRTAFPWWLVALAAGVGAAAILFGETKNNPEFGGGVIVVSPIRATTTPTPTPTPGGAG